MARISGASVWLSYFWGLCYVARKATNKSVSCRNCQLTFTDRLQALLLFRRGFSTNNSSLTGTCYASFLLHFTCPPRQLFRPNDMGFGFNNGTERSRKMGIAQLRIPGLNVQRENAMLPDYLANHYEWGLYIFEPIYKLK